MVPDIYHVEELISSNLKNGEKVIGTDVTPLTAPGENYGSMMLRIDIKIKNDISGEVRILNSVGKLVAEEERVQKIFKLDKTFRHEYKFYADIVPEFDRLLKSKGISDGADFAAPYYGGRLNLSGGDEVDFKNAIILMKNLRSAGYTTGKKSKGFDLETSMIVLKSLAKFHAAGIALKHFKPQGFDNFRQYFTCFSPEDHLYDTILSAVIKIVRQNGFSPEEVTAVSKFEKKEFRKINVNETWGTMIHYDSWTNNFLVKYKDEKPEHAVLVDFQFPDYGSPLNDVMFFLFTSVEIEQGIIEETIDTLLEYYYIHLIDYLKKLGLDTALFTKRSFEEEIKYAVHYEYPHAVWMLYPIMYPAFNSVQISQYFTDWSEKHVNRLVNITKICFKRGWLAPKKRI